MWRRSSSEVTTLRPPSVSTVRAELGVEVRTRRASERLVRRWHAVVVGTTDTSGFSDELLAAIVEVQRDNSVVLTVGRSQPNRIVEVRQDGVLIETERSGAAPQLVPAWMFEVAWRELTDQGYLTSARLQSSDGLNVKRSAAVMAVLAQLPRVGSASRPARIFLDGHDPIGATRNPAWDADERALALELYLTHGLLGKTHPAVIDLSEFLRLRAESAGSARNPEFRNPTGVALKLANFAAIDPLHSGAGMSRYSQGDLETWNELSGDTDELARRVDEIRRRDGITLGRAGDRFVPIEEQHVTEYVVTIDSAVRFAQRSEATLVLQFAAWLFDAGHEVGSDRHVVDSGALRPDLLDLTGERIWEAKSEVGRNAIRLAIGQLFDYRRFRPSWSIGVLLPRRPSDDLLDLCRTVGSSVAWPVRAGTTGFQIEEHP